MQQMEEDNINTDEFSLYWSWMKTISQYNENTYLTIFKNIQLYYGPEKSRVQFRHERHRHLHGYRNQLNICLDSSPTDVKFQYLLKFNICWAAFKLDHHRNIAVKLSLNTNLSINQSNWTIYDLAYKANFNTYP